MRGIARSLALPAAGLCAVGLLVGACADEPFSAGQGRAFRGGVHVLSESGTRRTALQLDPAYPQLELTSRFDLQLAGTAADERYAIQLRIELLRQLARYAFPDDKQELSVSMARGEQALRIDAVTGFLDVRTRDAEGAEGSAVVSVTLHDASGFAVAELDLVFGSLADGGG